MINGKEMSEPEIRAKIGAMGDENKELKRLLKLAVDTFAKLEENVDCLFMYNCGKCPIYNRKTDSCEWEHRKRSLEADRG